MIEVEKKFILREGDKEQLIAGAELVGKKEYKDTYFDTDEYILGKSDKWLRSRNNQFELKISVNPDRSVNQYRELYSEDEIRQALDLPKKKTLAEDLASAGYKPYGSWVVNRTTYKRGDFKIDFDEMDYGYQMVEIELNVNTEAEVPKVAQKILDFVRECGLDMSIVPGKNEAYLKKHDPKHYQALVEAGIF